MIRPCYRTGSHDGALLALYEEYARLVDAEAAGAHSSVQIMITGRLAPPPTALVAARVRRQDDAQPVDEPSHPAGWCACLDCLQRGRAPVVTAVPLIWWTEVVRAGRKLSGPTGALTWGEN